MIHDCYIKHNICKKKIPPPRPSRHSFGDLYGVTLRTVPQACFQGLVGGGGGGGNSREP